MPNCFSLTRLSEASKGPVSLNQIDRELCELLGEEVHPTRYVCGWLDYIGPELAMGRSWAAIWNTLGDDYYLWEDDEYCGNMAKILHYLQNNFSPNAWVEIGRR